MWTRDNYQLPAEGELCLTFAVTPRVNRLEDVVGVAMQTEILKLMQRTKIVDFGLGVLL